MEEGDRVFYANRAFNATAVTRMRGHYGQQIIFNMGDDVFSQTVQHWVVNISDLVE